MRKRRRVKKKAAVDTETTGLNVWTGCRPFMVTVALEEGEEWCYTWDLDPFTRKPIVPRRDRRELNDFFQDTSYAKGFFNLKFDLLMLESVGIKVPLFVDGERMAEEVSFMSRACNNLEWAHSLKPLAKKYLDYADDDETALHEDVKKCRRIAKKLGWKTATKETHGDKPAYADYWLPHMLWKLHPDLMENAGIDKDVCAEYAIGDVIRTLGLWQMYEEVMQDEGTTEWYGTEMELFPYVVDMERIGVRIDTERMEEVMADCRETRADCLERLCDAWGGDNFNPNSPQQVQKMFFGGRPKRFKPLKTTKAGNPSTDGESLMPYSSDELIRDYFTFKANDKAVNTFFGKYKKLATDDGEIVHPGFRQWGTKTTRFSCSEPNMQQVSSPESSNSKTREFLIDVRQVFIPRKGCVWYAPDYSQLEVIIFAALYNIETMLTAIRNGLNVHTAVTDRIWGGQTEVAFNAAVEVVTAAGIEVWDDWGGVVPCAEGLMDEFNWKISDMEESLGLKTYRKLSKSATFTKIFGGGPKALMGWIGCTYEEAKVILTDYEKSFPDMIEAMEAIEHEGRVNGYVMTPFGQKLCVDRWASYKIINHTVQASAAGLMKTGMLKCARYLKELDIGGRVAITIHDELIFEFLGRRAPRKVLKKICRMMSDHEGRFSVDTPVDLDMITERWSKKEKIKL